MVAIAHHVLAWVVLSATWCDQAVSVNTSKGEKQALLAYKLTWNKPNLQFFASWSDDTDPCNDSWKGVVCNCSVIPHAVQSACNSSQAEAPEEGEAHVLALNMSYPKGLILGGSIPQEFADLTRLLYLNLSNTYLSGTIPDSVLSSMQFLMYLFLNDNQLTGTLPSTIAELPDLKVANMAHNHLAGHIPSSWCNVTSPDLTVDIRGNADLCNIQGSCPDAVVELFEIESAPFLEDREEGVSVMRSMASTVGDMLMISNDFLPDECCWASDPTCDATAGCGVTVSPFLPPKSLLQFNYTPFNYSPTTVGEGTSELVYTGEVVFIYGYDNAIASEPLDDSNRYGWSLHDRRLLPDATFNISVRQPGGASKLVLENVTGPLWVEEWDVNVTNLSGLNGEQFAIRITAASSACASKRSSVLSSNAQIVGVGPETQQVFNTPYFKFQTTQEDLHQLGMSWLDWQDLSSVPCCWYWVQWFDITGLALDISEPPDPNILVNVTPKIYVGLNITTITAQADLEVGHTYIGAVFGANIAGVEHPELLFGPSAYHPLLSGRLAPPVQVVSNSRLGLLLGLLLGLGLGIPAVLSVLVWQRVLAQRERLYHHELRRMEHQAATLKRMMDGLVESSLNMVMDGSMDSNVVYDDVVFVITDLENSTDCAATDPKAYHTVQTIHDQIMKEGISSFNGYEVGTEGDSFQVAFMSVVDAVNWAVETQRRLLDVDWPHNVLKLPSCNAVYVNDLRSFYGPRVRMGITFAAKGSFGMKAHPHTNTKAFYGPAWQLAHEVGDCGAGGQILMTDYTWKSLKNNMAAANFPVVSSLGLFKLEAHPLPMMLYQVHHQIGRPFHRSFPPLRKVTQLHAGMGLRVIEPPTLHRQQDELQSSEGMLLESREVSSHKSMMEVLIQKTNGSLESNGSAKSNGTDVSHAPHDPDAQNSQADVQAGNGEGVVGSRKTVSFSSGAPTVMPHTTHEPQRIHSSNALDDRVQSRMTSMSTWVSDAVEMYSQEDGLTFVVCRIEKWVRVSEGEGGSAVRRWMARLEEWIHDSPELHSIPSWVLSKCYAVLAGVAMQFKGYVVEEDMCGGVLTVVFSSVQRGVSFCHSAQMALLTNKWTAQNGTWVRSCVSGISLVPTHAPSLGPTEKATDGRMLFVGPRVAMAVHTGNDFEVVSSSDGGVQHEGLQYAFDEVEYSGPALDLCRLVNRVVFGGQVVLTQEAWKGLQQAIPWGTQALSLGSHVLRVRGEPMDLMEVMPTYLQSRVFPTLPSLYMVRPGYRESPDPSQHVAICFVKVAKPHVVADALAMEDSCPDDGNLQSTLESYFSAVLIMEQVVREVVSQFDGYECKNPEPGKFTLAFRSLQCAVECCCRIQLCLLSAPWPEHMLGWSECEEVKDAAGRWVWRGPRVQCGVTWGIPDSRKPLSTGRADYYGSVANMSARIMALAQPGQVLVEGTHATRCLGAAAQTTEGRQQGKRFWGGEWLSPTSVVSKPIGCFKLKGFKDFIEIHEAYVQQLEGRTLAPIPEQPPPKRAPADNKPKGQFNMLHRMRSVPTSDVSVSAGSYGSTHSGTQHSTHNGNVTHRLFWSTTRRRPEPVVMKDVLLEGTHTVPPDEDKAASPQQQHTFLGAAAQKLHIAQMVELTADQLRNTRQLARLYVRRRQQMRKSNSHTNMGRHTHEDRIDEDDEVHGGAKSSLDDMMRVTGQKKTV